MDKQFKITNSDISIREDNGEFYTEGYVMTTHIDRAKEDGYENTMFTKEFCQAVVQAINVGGSPISTVGSRRTVSIQHDWIKEGDATIEPIGIAVAPARLDKLEDGHYGVWCRTNLNRMHEDFEEVKYKIEQGYFPGYSIEFIEKESEGISVAGRMVKVIKSFKEFLGYAYASARLIANPKAIITSFGYREVEEAIKNRETEDNNMVEEKIEAVTETPEVVVEEVAVEEQPIAESVEEAVVEPEKVEAVEEVVEEVVEVSEPVEEASQREVKPTSEEVVTNIRESAEFKEAVEEIKIRSKVLVESTEEHKMEHIKIRQLNEAVQKNDKYSIRQNTIDVADEYKVIEAAVADPASYTAGFRSNVRTVVAGKGFKTLGEVSVRGTLDSGSNASTYTQSPVEFADLFQPMINDIQNNAVNQYGFIEKENHVGGKYVQWKNVVNKDPLSNASAVDFDDVSVAKNYSDKINLQSPLKVYRRGVSVADTTLRYASQAFGDLFMKELEWQMAEMLNDIETDLFAEVADGAGSSILGYEAIADVTGNTTLYGLTRDSTTNFLTTGTLADTYVSQAGAITEAAIRNGIEKLETRGSNLARIAMVTSPKGKNYLFNLLDGNRRFNTTAADFGFNQLQMPSYDGIPIVTSFKCNSTLATAASSSACLYLVDRDQDKLVVGMAPTIVGLAKVGAGTEAYVQTDISHIYKDPRRIHMIDNFTTG